MALVYVVRCNFNEPAKEQAWNAWYSGPKIAQMLAKPYFRSCQRFARRSGNGRNYLALWTLQSPDAFNTEQYTTDWGFFQWAPHITGWSRDLFDGGNAPEQAFAVPPQGGLHIVSFDGASPDEAAAARNAVATSQPDMMWLPVIGLDRRDELGTMARSVDRFASVSRELREREQLHSTGIGDGVALPHARNALVGLVDRPVVVFGRREQGIPYGAVDGAPAKLFFLLVAPTVTQHLAVLARVSRLLRDARLRQHLLTVDKADRAIALIREAERKI